MLANGSALAGVLAVDVFANSHLAADRFQVRIAASVADMAGLQAPGMRLDVQVGLDDGWASLVVGAADALSFDPIRGVLEVEGRDLSAGLIEARVGETFANRTSSEIVEVVAGRHGLVADATPTSTPVGRYYQNEHERLTLGQFARAMTEWDLLAFLAGQEGFDLFMEGERLVFGPPALDGAVALRVEDCLGLELEHALGLSRAIEVTVRSWGTRAGAAVEYVARRGASGAGGGWGGLGPGLCGGGAEPAFGRAAGVHAAAATAGCTGRGELMDRFLNAIKGHTGAQDAAAGQPRFGVVTSVDSAAGTARVQLQPDGVLTGWLPLLSPWVGAGWGISCPPSPGDQVLVLPQEGDAEHGVIAARAWSALAGAPATPVGELWLTHRSGSYLRLLNDGTVSVRGDLHVEGDVYDRLGSLDQLRQKYNQHRHADPQGGITALPEPKDLGGGGK